MKEMHRISKFTNLESSTFKKKKFVYVRKIFLYWGLYLLYTGKPDISFKFSSDKNIISKRENLKIKESYVRQISNRIRTNYYLKKGNN